MRTEHDIEDMAIPLYWSPAPAVAWDARLRFAARGASVTLAGRRAEQLEAVAAEIAAQGGTALVVPTDITDPEQVQALVQRTV